MVAVLEKDCPVEVEAQITLTQAFNVLGFETHRNTRTAYREWLGLQSGQALTINDLLWLDAMIFWCSLGRGGRNAYYTKSRFALERSKNPEQLLSRLQEQGYVKFTERYNNRC